VFFWQLGKNVSVAEVTVTEFHSHSVSHHNAPLFSFVSLFSIRVFTPKLLFELFLRFYSFFELFLVFLRQKLLGDKII